MDSKYLRLQKTITDAFTDAGDEVGKSRMDNKKNFWNLFKNNNKDIRKTPKTSLWCFYC